MNKRESSRLFSLKNNIVLPEMNVSEYVIDSGGTAQREDEHSIPGGQPAKDSIC